MSKRRPSFLYLLLPLLACAVAACAEVRPADAPGAVILAEARRIVAQARQTRYSHSLDADEKSGRYVLDCSGFVALVLRNAAPKLLTPLAAFHSKKRRPLAEHFYAFFAVCGEESGWRRIGKVSEIAGGDVIAWANEEHEASANTGHVMIADGPPRRDPDGQWRLVILDATQTRHADDSRPADGTGVGRGTVWLQANAQGEAVSLRWKSPKGRLLTPPLAIGRAAAMSSKTKTPAEPDRPAGAPAAIEKFTPSGG